MNIFEGLGFLIFGGERKVSYRFTDDEIKFVAKLLVGYVRNKRHKASDMEKCLLLMKIINSEREKQLLYDMVGV